MRSLAFVLAIAASACSDPLRDRELESLGPETAGVPVGPLHRAGQACGACHGPDGPAESEFALSGTVYRTANDDVPLSRATVHVIDATGAQRSTNTNCAGNFWIDAGSFRPSFPVWVKLGLEDVVVEMTSPISRETSCNVCHAGEASPSSVGRAYFADTEFDFPEPPCD